MRYDPPGPSETDATWQAKHEPSLELKVWVLRSGAAMIHVAWAGEKDDTKLTEMPLDDMGVAVVQAHTMVDLLARVIARALRKRELTDPSVDSVDPAAKPS